MVDQVACFDRTVRNVALVMAGLVVVSMGAGAGLFAGVLALLRWQAGIG